MRNVAAALLASHRAGNEPVRYPAELRGWSSSYAYPQLCRFVLDGEAAELWVTTHEGGRWQIGRGGANVEANVEASASSSGANNVTFDIGGRACRLSYAVVGASSYFVLDGIEHVLTDTTYVPAASDSSGAASGRIIAPMNGLVVALHVRQGDMATTGQVLLVIEAMKMEHSIIAPLDGQVTSLLACIGDQVAPGQVLAEISLVE
jgi:geranyl-CoA carboxylase alpha subunit